MPMVRFEFEHATAGRVFLAGDFNAWDTTRNRLKRVRKGEPRFVALVELPPGRHEFKYFMDGEWACCPGAPRVDNVCGSENSVILVGERSR